MTQHNQQNGLFEEHLDNLFSKPTPTDGVLSDPSPGTSSPPSQPNPLLTLLL